MSGAEIGTILASVAALITATITYRKTAAEAKRTHSDIGLTNITAAGNVITLLRAELDRVNEQLTAQRNLAADLKGIITVHEENICKLEARIRKLEAFLIELGYSPEDMA